MLPYVTCRRYVQFPKFCLKSLVAEQMYKDVFNRCRDSYSAKDRKHVISRLCFWVYNLFFF